MIPGWQLPDAEMTFFDVFNGDADGICALHQLRLAQPRTSVLLTGLKRDLELLSKVKPVSGDSITVIDVSLDLNLPDLIRILNAGALVEYFDHHHAEEIPQHPNFKPHIDISVEVCSSLIVDKYLEGQFRMWAITGAFGDGMFDIAWEKGKSLGLAFEQIDLLRRLGQLLNYNSYGDAVEDLYFAPDLMYKKVEPYTDPFAFVRDTDVFQKLEEGYNSDLSRVVGIVPDSRSRNSIVFLLPDEPWARRVRGVFANLLSQKFPEHALAALHRTRDNTFTVSVRTPPVAPFKADEFCRRFPTGGGRATAGGINRLPEDQHQVFIREFHRAFSR